MPLPKKTTVNLKDVNFKSEDFLQELAITFRTDVNKEIVTIDHDRKRRQGFTVHVRESEPNQLSINVTQFAPQEIDNHQAESLNELLFKIDEYINTYIEERRK